MNHEEFSKEVHRRLCALDEDEAAQNPHVAIMRVARQVAFHHPFTWCKEIWLGRHARKALRERLRKEREKRE